MSPLVGSHNEPGGIWKGEAWEAEMQGGGLLHQWLLGGWGVMIGEMWDLEKLCERAVELKRTTCFVSSVPLKVSTSVLLKNYKGMIENCLRSVRSLMNLRCLEVLLALQTLLQYSSVALVVVDKVNRRLHSIDVTFILLQSEK